jgi:replicative DNA helicase
MTTKAAEVIEKEQIVLGCILADSSSRSFDVVGRVAGVLKADDFFRDIHQKIYGAILALFRRKIPADQILLSWELADQKDLEKIGGASYLAALDDLGFHRSNIQYYADQIKKEAERRRLHAVVGESIRKIESGEKTTKIIAGLSRLKSLEADEVVTGKNVVRETYDMVAAIQEGTLPALIWTGYGGLDEHYAPAPDSLAVIGALPSVGKTSFALGIAGNMADRGVPIYINSVEGSNRSLGFRLLSKVSGIETSKMKRKNGMVSDEWNRMGEAAETLSQHPLYFANYRDPAKIVATAERLSKENGIKAVFIDYLGLLSLPKADRHDLQLASVMHLFANLAHEIGLVVYVLSQINRSVENRAKPEPLLSDLSGSGSIEQDADLVYLLHRPRKNKSDDDEITISVAKQREGPTGKVTLRFDKGHIRQGRMELEQPNTNWRES